MEENERLRRVAERGGSVEELKRQNEDMRRELERIRDGKDRVNGLQFSFAENSSEERGSKLPNVKIKELLMSNTA